MKIGVKVGDVMTRQFVSVSPDIPVAKCAREMMAKHVGSLIVKDNQHLRGIITEGDIIKAIAANKNLSKINAGDVMTKNVVSVSPSEDMYNALVKMRGKNVRWLPVTIKGRVIGMLTVKDILRIEPSLFEIVKEFTPIREESEKLSAIKTRKRRDSLAKGDAWTREGECEECGSFGLLYNIEGKMLCEDCKGEED